MVFRIPFHRFPRNAKTASLVSQVWIDGKVMKDPGDLDGRHRDDTVKILASAQFGDVLPKP
jgi:hypothetical protein